MWCGTSTQTDRGCTSCPTSMMPLRSQPLSHASLLKNKTGEQRECTNLMHSDLEWHAELPEISEQEKQQLDRIQASYLHLVSQTSMVEDVVKMTVVSPLLYLADFFLP